MNILLVNDDGIQSEGIQVLAERLADENKVYVIAPDSNRSAVSQHISMYDKTILKPYAKNQWSCSGYPADCVGIGLCSELLDEKIDIVISGINRGANLGTDIIYSGTCGAAKQAVLNGVPGIALSIDSDDMNQPLKFDALADFVAKNLQVLSQMCLLENPRVFVNVNGFSLDSYKGVKLTNVLCERTYGDKFSVTEQENYLTSKMIMGNVCKQYEKETDWGIVREGYVCVSPVYVEPVTYDVVDGITFKL